jgi:hypothetical protein
MVLAKSEITGKVAPCTILTGLTPHGKPVYDPMADIDLLSIFEWENGDGFLNDSDFVFATANLGAERKQTEEERREARVLAHVERVQAAIAAGQDIHDEDDDE